MNLHQKNVTPAEEISNPSYRGYRKDPIALSVISVHMGRLTGYTLSERIHTRAKVRFTYVFLNHCFQCF